MDLFIKRRLEECYLHIFGLSHIDSDSLRSFIVTSFKRVQPKRMKVLFIHSHEVWKSDTFLIEKPILKYSSGHTNIYEGMRKTNQVSELTLCKQEVGRSIVLEAFIQCTVQCILECYGLIYAVPKVKECFIHPQFNTMFTMEPIYNSVLASTFLTNSLDFNRRSRKNDILIINIISQLAIYLSILERHIGFNHCDLKSNNILLIKHLETVNEITVSLEPLVIRMNINYQAVLLDYEFACIGSTDGLPLLSGMKISSNDRCPKDGRDMFTYLSTLYRLKTFRDCLTDTLKNLFSKWLVTSTKDWAGFLEGGLEKEDMIRTYLFAMGSSFSCPNSNPLTILADIAKQYPECLSVV
jgi:serine/threonine protein kinase